MNVKVGDKVEMIYGGERFGTIVTVEKVTPTGLIKTSGYTFNPDGSQRGNGDRWYRRRIYEITPERMEEIREHRYINRTIMMCRNVGDLTYQQAVIIRKALGGSGLEPQESEDKVWR